MTKIAKIESALKEFPNPFDGKNLFTYKGYFSFNVKTNKEEAFNIFSNTSKLNKYMGLPPRIEVEKDGERYVESSLLGIKTKWLERPWKWISGQYMLVNRIYQQGPALHEHIIFQIKSINENEQTIEFYYQGHFKNFLWVLFYKLSFPIIGKKMKQAFNKILLGRKHKKSKILLKRKILNDLEFSKNKNINYLIYQILKNKEDEEVYQLKIPFFAENFNLPKKELLSAFIKAVKYDLFEICWDIICPHCHGVRHRPSRLEKIVLVNECDACQLTFHVDRVDYIDATFRINPSIREVKNIVFCSAEPHKKKHILLQEKINPKNEKCYIFNLVHGEYRIRIIGVENIYSFKVNQDKEKEDEIINWDGSENKEVLSSGGQIKLTISHKTEGLFIVEKKTFPPHYFCPTNLFNHFEFRNLFSNEKLGKGIQLRLPQQIILFTDIVGSTKFYENVGDEQAYREIDKHFDIIKFHLEKNKGILIKTIGDAVMASFPTADDLLKTCKEIDRTITEEKDLSLKIRYSAHLGPMIAVNFNTGIDYFGNHVNTAAKLQAIAGANEIAVSQRFFDQIQSNFTKLEPLDRKAYLDQKYGYIIPIKSL